jgi:hypothetical protein
MGYGLWSGQGAPRVRSISNTRRLVAPQHTAASCHEETHAPQQTASSVDHFVGEREQRVRDSNAERPGGVEVHDQFEFGRLHDRQVGRLLAFEDAANIDAGLAIPVCNVRPIAHQSADLGKFTHVIDRG